MQTIEKGKTILVTPAIRKAQIMRDFNAAAGILKHLKINPLGYQRSIRAEWETRLKRQIRLSKPRK